MGRLGCILFGIVLGFHARQAASEKTVVDLCVRTSQQISYKKYEKLDYEWRFSNNCTGPNTAIVVQFQRLSFDERSDKVKVGDVIINDFRPDTCLVMQSSYACAGVSDAAKSCGKVVWMTDTSSHAITLDRRYASIRSSVIINANVSVVNCEEVDQAWTSGYRISFNSTPIPKVSIPIPESKTMSIGIIVLAILLGIALTILFILLTRKCIKKAGKVASNFRVQPPPRQPGNTNGERVYASVEDPDRMYSRIPSPPARPANMRPGQGSQVRQNLLYDM